VKPRATRSGNTANFVFIQHFDALLIIIGVHRFVRVIIQKPCPATTNTKRLMPFFVGSINQSFDTGIQAGNIASTG
jgi:hypothetical protein